MTDDTAPTLLIDNDEGRERMRAVMRGRHNLRVVLDDPYTVAFDGSTGERLCAWPMDRTLGLRLEVFADPLPGAE